MVSVIMLTMSRPQYLDPAIESVRKQGFADWELIIVHDGTDPRIAPVVQSWVERDPRIRYFHRPIPGNIADGMNYGIARSRGRYIAVLDDDDAWIHPEKLRLQIDRLEQDPSLVAVGGGAVVVDGAQREVMRYKKSSDPEECRRRALVSNPLIHSTVLFRKDTALEIGLYDVGLAGYQDWDLWLKLMRRGNIMNLPEYFATYRVWNGGGSSRNVMANAWSAVRIVNRHGGHYRGYVVALAANLGYMMFASLPGGVRRRSYQSLSRIKKRLFSTQN
jgi:glycosyltransferase involved in cell wall biosynthesis